MSTKEKRNIIWKSVAINKDADLAERIWLLSKMYGPGPFEVIKIKKGPLGKDLVVFQN